MLSDYTTSEYEYTIDESFPVNTISSEVIRSRLYPSIIIPHISLHLSFTSSHTAQLH